MNLSDKMAMKCEQILRGLNIVFYIKTDSGVELTNGNIQVLEKTARKRRKPDVPYGTFTNLLKDQGIENMKEGSVIVVDCGNYSVKRMQSVASAFAVNRWGKGTVTTAIHDNILELMRHAPLDN